MCSLADYARVVHNDGAVGIDRTPSNNVSYSCTVKRKDLGPERVIPINEKQLTDIKTTFLRYCCIVDSSSTNYNNLPNIVRTVTCCKNLLPS